ncbi:MAG: hypothetical protein IKC83_00350 [Clostridia bacterium]|nr:hypothetical protein [Clostridia bacterium]
MNVYVNYNEVRYKYVLLPLWVCNFGYKGKTYNFFINGETGRTAGKTPLSPLKVGLAVLIGLGVVGGLIWLLYHGGFFW